MADPGIGQNGGYVNAAEAVAARAGLGVGATGQPTTQQQGVVYLGPYYEKQVGKNGVTYQTGETYGPKSGLVPVDFAKQRFMSFGPNERKRWAEMVKAYTGLSAPSPERQNTLWNNAVDYAAYNSQILGKPISPWEMMQQFVDINAANGGGAYSGPVTTTSHTQNINLTNPSQAQLLVDNALNQYLGRNATENERATFLKALNKLETANPQVTDSTQTTTPGRGTQSITGKSTTKGGIDASVVAEEYAASRPQAAETMMSGQYMDWFMQKLAQDPMGGLEIGG